MKAITLHQPWATLVSLGVKTIETRSWTTRYRGPLAIHAAKTDEWNGAEVGEWTYHHNGDDGPEVRRLGAVVNGELVPDRYERGLAAPAALGAVVVVCTLVDVRLANSAQFVADDALRGAPNWSLVDHSWRSAGEDFLVRERERPYGDYRPGRFAWLLADVMPVEPPAPARGRQQLWEWSA